MKLDGGFSKAVVALCTLNIMAFTATVLYFNWNGIAVDTTLVLCFFAVFGLEYASLAGIKRAKIKNSPIEVPQVPEADEPTGKHAGGRDGEQ